MYSKLICLIFITILTLACQRNESGSNGNDCKYGAPKAVFLAQDEFVESHEFVVNENEATEQVSFQDGTKLTLIQSGCENIRQEFRFALDSIPDNTEPSYWIAQTVAKLRLLGSLGPDYFAFTSWAQEIEQQMDTIKLSESFELQPGFFVRIDPIRGANDATLVLILSDVP